MKIEEKVISDAESTIKFAIYSAMVDNWPPRDTTKLRDAIFNRMFEPDLKWAVEQYLNEQK